MTLSPVTEADLAYLDNAERLAKRGLGRTWPNPSVGALIVRPRDGGEIIARGWTQPGGRPHAEQMALAKAGKRARGATAYVTLEPCAHTGKTPPCAQALIDAGIARVVCSLSDPDPRVSGKGFGALTQAGIEISLATDAKKARRLVQGHLLRQTDQRPFIQLKLALGADGKCAPAKSSGGPVWVTGERARAHGHLLRARVDAILVGSGTALEDDPELTCRLPGMEGQSPIRIVFDTNLRLPADSKLAAGAKTTPLWLLCSPLAEAPRRAKLEALGARVFETVCNPDGKIDVSAAVELLADQGITRVLLEGGPRLARSFLDAGLIDEAVIFAGSQAVGNAGLLPFVDEPLEYLQTAGDYRLCRERAIGSDRMTIYGCGK